MATLTKHLGSFLTGLFAWSVAIYSATVLLDIAYSYLAPNATFSFSIVTDYLLPIILVIFLVATTTIAFSKKTNVVRNLLIGSQLILLAEFLIPAIFSLLGLHSQGNPIDIGLKVFFSVAASILAFIGQHRYNQQQVSSGRP